MLRQIHLDPKGHKCIRTLFFRSHGDPSDYDIGGYLFMVTNGKDRVMQFFSKALVGPQLNSLVREKESSGIFYGVWLFEDLFDNRPFILKTDHVNLTYFNTFI